MRIRVSVGFLFFGLVAVHALAAPVPCRFGGFDGDHSFEDIGAAYKAADLVVIGTVAGKTSRDNNVSFHVRKVIKGTADTPITLHAHHAKDTEINGFVLPENKEFLLFLVQGPLGIFDSVENYNSGCAISFSIRNANVVLVETDEHNRGVKIPVNQIEQFLDSSPPKLIHRDR